MKKYRFTRVTASPALAFFCAEKQVFRTAIAAVMAVAASLILIVYGNVAHAAPQEASNDAMVRSTGTTMGTVTYEVQTWKPGMNIQAVQSILDRAIEDELELVNQKMSTYIDSSEVSRFNAFQSTEWFSVSKDTARVVEKAQQVSKASNGAFDITVQPLVELWKFGTDKENPRVPSQEEIDEIMKGVGYQKLDYRIIRPAIRKTIPDLQIDLSAVAKGYAVDRVAQRLHGMDFHNYMIEVGGEVRTAGEKPDKSGWRIGIEKPVQNERTPFKVVELFHKSLASSGDYRNFYEIDGKRYSHTIDPRTGRPVEDGISAASVIAKDCATADAVATALMAMNKEEGLKLANTMNVAAIVMTRSGEQIDSEQTDDFASFTKTATAEINKPKEASLFRMITIAAIVFCVAIVGMAIGVIFGRERIKGSCGGIAALDNPDAPAECSICSRASECDDLKKEMTKRNAE